MEEALTGEAIRFSGAPSSDPDGGPAALAFSWDFGDGDSSALRDPEHTFSRPRAYVVSLTVDDGADTAVAVVTVHVLATPTTDRPVSTSPLSLSLDEAYLWAVNPDSDSVSTLDLRSGDGLPRKLDEILVGGRPRTLAFTRDGEEVLITKEDGDTLCVLSARDRKVASTVRVGRGPFGVAVAPASGKVLVSLAGEARLAILDGRTLAPRKVLATDPYPRAIAISCDGKLALLTHLISAGAVGKVSVIDLENEAVARVIDLVADPGPDTPSSGRGIPNLLAAVAIEPGGTAGWIGGLKSNSLRGLVRDAQPLNSVNRVRGLISRIDLDAGQETPERRIDLNNADSGSAIAFSPRGRHAYVTHQGLGSISTYDLSAATLVRPGDGSTVPFTSRVPVGDAPQGIVLTRDGKRGYVLSFLSRAVAVLDLSDPAKPTSLGLVPVTDESLSPAVANGKRLFHRSTAPVHSSDGYIACASCHADGGMHDGQTWDFTDAGEGLRNTIDLRGRGGMAHGPVHWSANFDEIQDFENDIVSHFGGTGFANDGKPPNPPLGPSNAGRSEDLDDLAAYVATLTGVPPSPYRKSDGTLSDAAIRGRAVFLRPDTGCAACHVPPRYTDSVLTPDPADYVLHDVGTLTAASGKRLGGPLPGLDTPTLKGIWATAPYLHDGSAPGVIDVLVTRNRDDRHGKTSHLSSVEIADLAEYLLSLDEETASPPPPPYRRGDSNCDGRVNISDPIHSLEWLFLGGSSPCCLRSADANGDRRNDLSDALFTLSWLFLDSPPPPPPGPLVCGVEVDPAPGLECASYPEERC